MSTNKMLSPEQERIFEENQKLVYLAINKYIKNPGQYGLNDYEDLEQIGNIALCHAILTYKPGTHAFSTYATVVIRNKLYNATRDNSDASDSASDIEDKFIEANASIMYNNIDSFDEAYEEKEQKRLLKKLGESYGGVAQKGVEAIIMQLDGYTCGDIAEMFKTDSTTISSWISRARSKLKTEPELLKLLGR